MLEEIPKMYSLNVTWNFFGEYHGKNIIDGHFGLISRWLKELECSHQITNIEGCIFHLQQQLQNSNRFKEDPDKLRISFKTYDRVSRPEKKIMLRIADFSKFHCFTSTKEGEDFKVSGFTTSQKFDANCLQLKLMEKLDIRKTKLSLDKTNLNISDVTPTQKKKALDRLDYFLRRGDLDMLSIMFSKLSIF